jgi:outer membrane protein OmpA-like peptidoglycan-associated protein
MKTIHMSIAVLILGGCATIAPPKELRDARSADKAASQGVTAKLNAADLHGAKASLKIAEESFAEDGDTQQTRDLSYTANMGFQIADSRARTINTKRQRDQAIAQMQANILAHGERTSEALDSANRGLEIRDQKMRNEQQRHAASEKGSAAALQAEQERRMAAEKLAARAVADLAALGTVKQEPRGMVLTLSGSVLFESAKSELLPSARAKLNQVAEALIKQDPDSEIVVEGFTDSQGTASYNQELSQRRAQTVRDYLVTRGIASDRVASQGFGPTRPVAANNSAEGRANNRRVEIVVKPSRR